MYNTRIAPSPTGHFHLGTARTAYFCWLAARASGGKFLVRIDDTDKERSSEEYIQPIYDALEWLGLDYDETFRQSSRLDRHKEMISRLCQQKKAWLTGPNPPHSFDGSCILQYVPHDASTWHDEIVGDIPISKTDQMRIVLCRWNGTPTYHLANVVDDIDYDINFVIRGQDHISNTARQLAIYEALEVDPPLYAHVGLIHKDKKLLSKRDGAASLMTYRDAGYDPDAVLNFLLRMGWGPRVDDKSAAIITKERAVELFLTGGAMRPAPAGFDQMKLDWYNRKYKAMKGNR